MYKMYVFLIVLLIMASTALFAQEGGNGSPSVQGQEQPAPQVAVDGNSAVQTAQLTAPPQNNTITIDRQTYETALRANTDSLSFLKWFFGIFISLATIILSILQYRSQKQLQNARNELSTLKTELNQAKTEHEKSQKKLYDLNKEYKDTCDEAEKRKNELEETIASSDEIIYMILEITQPLDNSEQEKLYKRLQEQYKLFKSLTEIEKDVECTDENKKFKKGLLFKRKGMHTKAIEYFNKAIETSGGNTTNVDIFLNRSTSFKAEGKFEEANVDILKVLKIMKDNPKDYINIERIYLEYIENNNKLYQNKKINTNTLTNVVNEIEDKQFKKSYDRDLLYLELAVAKATLNKDISEIITTCKKVIYIPALYHLLQNSSVFDRFRDTEEFKNFFNDTLQKHKDGGIWRFPPRCYDK